MSDGNQENIVTKTSIWRLVISIGIVLATSVLSYKVTQDSLPAALIMTVLSSLVAIVFNFGKKVWGRVEEKLVDKAAEEIETQVEAMFSTYEKDYLEQLDEEYRRFDDKGLPVMGSYRFKLGEVFVQLRIARESSAKVHPSMVSKKQADTIDDIWYFLQQAEKNFVILGGPGSGKSTILRHVSLALANPKENKHRSNIAKIPILLFLRRHSASIDEALKQKKLDYSLLDLIAESTHGWDLQAPLEWFKKQLSEGNCLVMLDGLDEVLDPDLRKDIVEWVDSQITRFHRNRFIITSRPLGYEKNKLSKNDLELEVQPFNPDQIEQFVLKWYIAAEKERSREDGRGVQREAERDAHELLERIRSSSTFSKLATNPLLLTLITGLQREGQILTDDRIQLYEEICKVALGKRWEALGVKGDGLTAQQKQRVLEPLAYFMMEQHTSIIDREQVLEEIKQPLRKVNPKITNVEFLKIIEERSGLFIERDTGRYEFAHLSFQEYLASVHVQQHHEKYDTFLTHIGDAWWHETIRFYSASTDATSIIKACLYGSPPSAQALALAIDCETERLEIDEDVSNELKQTLEKRIEDDDPRWRKTVAEALLLIRLRQLKHINDNLYIDTTPITHAEYQLFIDEQKSHSVFVQPDHWASYNYPVGQGRKPIAGIRPSDAVAFCEWLTAREANEWMYRIPHAREKYTDDHFTVGYWTHVGEDRFHLAGSQRPNNTTLSQTSLLQRIDEDCTPTIVIVIRRAREIARVIALASDLTSARDLALALASDIASVRALVRAKSLDIASALARARDIARDLDLDHPSALVRPSALAHPSDLDRAKDHARDLDLDLARDLTSARDITSARDLASARNLASALARDLASALTNASDLDLDLNLDPNRVRERVTERDSTLDRTLDLDPNRDPNRDRDLDLDPNRVRERFREREYILLIMIYLLKARPEAKRFSGSNEKREQITKLIDDYLDIYVDLVILQERVEGKLEAFEGLRIVRERKPTQTR